MSRALIFQNRQRIRRIDMSLLRRITLYLLMEILGEEQFELGVHLVGAEKMAEVNETFLQHSGSTDVITFDHSSFDGKPGELHGEIFICIDDAIAQAHEFQTTWQSELVRYIVHGVLHLKGFDDLEPVARKKMKKAENLRMEQLSAKFALSRLQKKKTP